MVGRKLALDSNVVIDFLRNDKKIREVLLISDVVFVPIIVSGELIFGALNSNNPEKELVKYTKFIEKCYPLPVDENVAENYANIRLKLKKLGKPIPENDIWIAAICITNSISLITHDKHFTNIENLDLIFINQEN